MLKVILAAPIPPPYGGIGNWVLLLRKHIEDRKDIVFVYLNTAPASRGIDGRSLWQRVVVQGLLMLKSNRQLKMAIRSERPDAIHITTSGQLATIRDIMFLKTAKKRGIKSVYHIRFGRTDEISRAGTREWKYLKRAMGLASIIMPIDKTTENAVKRELPGANVRLVPNPIEINKMRPYVNTKANKSVAYVGWMVKTKGVEELIEAWNIVTKEFPDYTLDMIGPGNEDYIEHLRAISKNSIVFHGEKPHEEALEIMSRCEVFVLPSYTEGFPNVILEAMAMKKAIIATNVGAIPDILAGNCGEIVVARNVPSLCNALINVISDKNKQCSIAENAYEKVTSQYSLEYVFNEYMEVWRTDKKNYNEER